MRRAALVPALVLGLAIASDIHAQTIGFRLGGSLTDQVFEPNRDRSSIGSFAGGGFVRFGLGRIGVQLEALAITKGSAATDGDETRLEYIEVPLLLHASLTPRQPFAPYIVAGPAVGFDIGCEVETPGGDELDCADRKKLDFGITAGGGVAAATGPGALLVEGRYTWGLANISEETGVEIRNRGALFTVGYEIPIGRRF